MHPRSNNHRTQALADAQERSAGNTVSRMAVPSPALPTIENARTLAVLLPNATVIVGTNGALLEFTQPVARSEPAEV